MNPFEVCLKKKHYPTKHEAESSGAMQEMLQNIKLKVYQCPRCKLWHLTKRDAEGILTK